jgi:hypothetical protein
MQQLSFLREGEEEEDKLEDKFRTVNARDATELGKPISTPSYCCKI